MGSSFQVVGDLPRRPGLRAIDEHLHLALLGPDHHRLLAQPAHHVEWTARLPPQRQLQHVVLHAALDDLPQLLGDGKEAIGGTQPLQGLVGPPVVVVLHPQPDPLAGRLEAVELRALQELLPDGLPEAFDLAQRHGVVRAALDVVDPFLPQLRLEPSGPAPARVLAALVGEQLFGHAVLRHRPAEHLKHVLRRLAAEHIQPHHVAGVVVEEADEVGVLAAQPEGEDVGLPQLVGRGALEAARLGRVPPRLGARGFEELVRVQGAAHRLPAHGEEQDAPEELADLLDPQVGMTPLEVDDFRFHRRGHLRPLTVRPGRRRLQARLALRAILPNPLPQRAQANA